MGYRRTPESTSPSPDSIQSKVYDRCMRVTTGENTLGLELKVARIRKGLYLYEVAREVGITPARLSQFEGGHRKPPPDLEEKLRAVLDLPAKQQNEDEQKS